MTDYNRNLVDLNRQLESLILIFHKKPSKVKKLIFPTIGIVIAFNGFTALISSFGTTSNGTAIASLSGAAEGTAVLYWLGSLVGLGAGAGTIMTGGIGLLGGYVAYQILKIPSISMDDLSGEEKLIVSESSSLIHVINIETLDRLGGGDITNSVIKDRLVELTNATIGYFFDYSGKALDSRYQMRLVNVIRELRNISKKL